MHGPMHTIQEMLGVWLVDTQEPKLVDACLRSVILGASYQTAQISKNFSCSEEALV